MLPDFTLFLKQAHMDEIYELSMQLLLHALLKRQNKKGGIFFFFRSGASSPTAGKFGSALPGTDLGQRRALSQQRSSPGAAGSDSVEARGINRRRAVALRIAGGTPYLSIACARVDIYGLRVGKVRYVSYDGKKRPR